MQKVDFMSKLLAGVFVAAAMLVGIGSSRAAVINDVELVGETVTFGNDAFSTQNGLAGQSGLAGEIILTASGGNTINAWCMDLFHDVYLGNGQNLTYTGATLVGASNRDGGFLTAVQAQQIAGLVEYGDQLVANGGGTDQAAGIQMAIWATEYAGLTFAGPSAAVTAEQADLALAPSLNGRVESLVSLTGTQQLVSDTNQIPEPASFGLMGVGMLGLGFVRRQSVSRA